MAKTDLWMPLYIGDYLSDTMELDTEQHGAYLLLLMHYWKQRGPIPDNDRRIAAITRMPMDRWMESRGLILGYFSLRDGFWHNKRLDSELERREAVAERNKSNGAKGGRPKGAEKTQTKPTENPEQNPNETQNKGNTQSQSQLKDTPTGGDKPPDDRPPIERIFSTGLQTLTSRGVLERHARSLLGKARQKLGDGETLNLLDQIEQEDIADPAAWLSAHLRTKPAHGRKQSIAERSAEEMRIAQEWDRKRKNREVSHA